MTGYDLVMFLSEHYHQRINDNSIDNMIEYFDDMIDRGRVITVEDDDDKLCSVLTFYLGYLAEDFYRPDSWTSVGDNPHGDTIYIDKFYGKPLTNETRRDIQETIQTTFPNVVKMKYHRPSPRGDRYVVFKSTRYKEVEDEVPGKNPKQ